LFLQGILPVNQSLQGGERIIFFEIGLFSSVDEAHVSLERKPFVLEAGPSGTYSSYENWHSF
jgi:hypothetical protein